MEYIYKATVTPDPDGGFLITFDDVPEAITAGADRAEALANAREALGLALLGILEDGCNLPAASANDGEPIAVAPCVAAEITSALKGKG
ncbi:type II toxin-antitoxin system HicB family antitoxin [Shinella sp. M27]|uniref:type II toxin-antitoxin system HicB family antitoxin n=1 Tax=Shinella sp. M27 TaxID=3368614 RepID=UPI003BA04988